MSLMAQYIVWLQLTTNIIFLVLLLRVFYNILPVVFLRSQALPFVPTNKRVVRMIVSTGVLKNARRVVDMGCGDGQCIQRVQRAYPRAQYTGIEWKPVLAQLAKWRLRYSPIGRLRRLPQPDIQQGDMFAYNLSQTDAVIGFWVPEFAKRLVPKCIEELPEGAVIISNLFALPLSHDEQKLFSHQTIITSPWWSFTKDKVHIYTKR